LAALRTDGVRRIVMLSGDHADTAAAVRWPQIAGTDVAGRRRRRRRAAFHR
jgi:hypothetical protein